MEIFYHFIHVEYLTKKEKEVVEIERIVCLESCGVFLVDFEYDRLRIGVNCC